MNTTLIEAQRAIRGIVNCHDEEVLELLRAILARTNPRTATGSAVLDACQAVEDSISDRYLREAEEAYQASPCYRQDRRNDAISKGG